MSTEPSITGIGFNELAESAPVGIFLTDAGGAAVYANPALSQITGIAEREFLGPGWPAVIGARVAGAGESGDQAGRDLAASARRACHGESKYRIGRPDGSSRLVDIRLREVRGHDGLPTGYIGIIGDITEAIEAAERDQAEERRQAEEDAWRNAERLESLRRMAGGVAHDFNNLHASVLGYAQLADEAIATAQAALPMSADLGRQLRAIPTGSPRSWIASSPMPSMSCLTAARSASRPPPSPPPWKPSRCRCTRIQPRSAHRGRVRPDHRGRYRRRHDAADAGACDRSVLHHQAASARRARAGRDVWRTPADRR